MELETDVIFLVLLPEIMIYLFIYLLQVRFIGTTELKNIPYISVLGLPARSTSVSKKPGCSD